MCVWGERWCERGASCVVRVRALMSAAIVSARLGPSAGMKRSIASSISAGPSRSVHFAISASTAMHSGSLADMAIDTESRNMTVGGNTQRKVARTGATDVMQTRLPMSLHV